MKQLDQLMCDAGIVGEALFDIGLVKGQPCLAQIAAVSAQQRHFTPVQPCQYHQSVEPVIFNFAAEDMGKGLLEIFRADIGLEQTVGAELQGKVADPDAATIVAVQAIGMFIQNLHAHVFQHRQAL